MQIPKIIHQIWIQGQDKLPKKYHKWQNSFKKMNPNFEYILWDDNKIKLLLKRYFPYLFEVYDQYNYLVQKADFGRYMVLYIYGGIYADMDCECMQPLNGILKDKFFCYQRKNNFFVKIGSFGELNNHVIGSIPKHPILKKCLKLMYERKNVKKIIPSYTISHTTGPFLFTTAVNSHYDKVKMYGDDTFPINYNKQKKYDNLYIAHHPQCSDRKWLCYFNHITINHIIIICIIFIAIIIYFL